MPSRADGRRIAEGALRALALAAIVVALVLAGRERASRASSRIVEAPELPRALATLPPDGDTLVVRADTALDARALAWLAARRDAGAPVRWSDAGVAPLAVSVTPLRDPASGVSAHVASSGASAVRLADSAGFLDSAVVRTAASFAMPRPVGTLALRVGDDAARVLPPGAANAKEVVVLARAGWEGKFVLALAEERGWKTRARFVVRPDEAVRQGNPLALDTARVAVLVALDGSAARDVGRIGAFVRAGGGLVLGPEAARDPAFAALRAGAPGTRRPAEALAVGAEAPRRALALDPVSASASVVALERRGGDVAVAARRLGAGRVVQVGYDETWRWRMTGPEGAPEAHRAWWAAIIAAASAEAMPAEGELTASGDAPRARMIAALGPPIIDAGETGKSEPPGEDGLLWWLGVGALALLVAEWASRRLRGAR